MNVRHALLPLAIAAATVAAPALAGPYAPFDTRSAAMGGVGVASARSATAGQFNPALMSMQAEGDKFQFALGAGAIFPNPDENDFIDEAEDISATFDRIDALSDETLTYDVGTNSSPELAKLAAEASTLSSQLKGISGDSLQVGGGTGIGFGVPGKKLGVGAFGTVRVDLASAVLVSSTDTLIIDTLAQTFDGGFVTKSEVKEAVNSGLITYDKATDTYQVIDRNAYASQGNVIGTAVAEAGVALSREFEIAGRKVAFGVTPKMVNVLAYDYLDSLENFDGDKIDIKANETEADGVDLDVGAVYRLGDTPWQVGAVIRNLVGVDARTVNGKTFGTDLQTRVGVAHMGENFTAALDLDLAENDGVLGSETQFLAAGVEYSAFTIDLRAGYRLNLADSNVGDVFTAGLGLGPVEISAALGDEQVGAFAQVSFGW